MGDPGVGSTRSSTLLRAGPVDHQTALEAANQALSGGSLRSTGRFTSVELRGVDDLRRGRVPMNLDEDSHLPSGAWELAAMVCVGVATLMLVVTLWLL
jgi:hypothetical protein